MFFNPQKEYSNMTFRGVIIEESLEDKSLLDMVDIASTAKEYLEDEANKGMMTLYKFFLDEKRKSQFIRKAMKAILNGWYMHFCGRGVMTVIFKDKSFHFTRRDTDKIKKAESYGQSIGIMPSQMNFAGMIDDPWG